MPPAWPPARAPGAPASSAHIAPLQNGCYPSCGDSNVWRGRQPEWLRSLQEQRGLGPDPHRGGRCPGGAFAIAAALAAGGDDRTREGSTAERMAIWQAGYSPHELRLLAGLAALARTDLDAAEVEVVLTRGDGARRRPGGHRQPAAAGAPRRDGAFGEGIAGRGLRPAGRRWTRCTSPWRSRSRAPTGSSASSRPRRARAPLRHLAGGPAETLAAEHGRRLGIRAASLRDAG